MRNLIAAKRSSYQAFFSFLPYLCIIVVAPTWLRIIKHKMAVTFHTLNISYLKMLLLIFSNSFCKLAVSLAGATLSNIHCLNRVTALFHLSTILCLVSSTCLCVCLPVCLSVLSVCLSVCLSACQICTYVIRTYVRACMGT